MGSDFDQVHNLAFQYFGCDVPWKFLVGFTFYLSRRSGKSWEKSKVLNLIRLHPGIEDDHWEIRPAPSTWCSHPECIIIRTHDS